MSGFAVAARGVTKRFGPKTALEAATVTIEPGEFVGVLGWNGAGKTTLLRLLAGLIPPDAGTVTVFGHDVRRDRAKVRALAGYLPQCVGVDEFLTVEENIQLRADLYGVTGSIRRTRTFELLRLTGLADAVRTRVAALSQEMKRRLGLACTLIGAPRIVLLDEPTLGLDSASRRSIFQIARNLALDGITVVWGSCHVDEAESCDRVIFLSEGRVIAQGTPADLTLRANGRTRMITLATCDPHEAAAALHGEPGVLDVRVLDRALRVLTDRVDRDIRSFAPGDASASQIVPPRLEDALIIILRDHGAAGTLRLPPYPVTERRITGTALEVRELCKRFDSRVAIEGLNFTVAPGEVFGLVGSDGAGKTTVLRMLCGAIRPTRGSITVRGLELADARSGACASVGVMSQNFSLYDDLTVRQNLRFLAGVDRMDRDRRSIRINQVAAECGLESYLGTYVRDLTDPIRRRLALAAALLNEPTLILLDEPGSDCDPLVRCDLWRRIRRATTSGAAVVVASRLMEDADYCDRVLLLNRGRAVVVGTPAEVKAQAASADGRSATVDGAHVARIHSREESGTA